MNINCFFPPGPDPSSDGSPILCLRNDGGRLRGSPGPSLIYAKCDVCGDKYTVELLEATIKSTWEALRLGYTPTVRKPWGGVALVTMSFNEHGPIIKEDYQRELQPYSIGFIGMRYAGERWSR